MAAVPDLDAVADIAQRLLDYVAGVFEDSGVALPERRYRHVGEPAYDDEQMVVTLDVIRPGAPGRQASGPQQCVVERFAVLVVELVRCVPVQCDDGTPPAAADLDAAAAGLLRDAWVMQRAVEGVPSAGVTLDGYSVAVGDLTGLNPGGGLAGVAVPVHVAL